METRIGRTPASRDNQLISLAYDLVEQRLRDGTASPAETTLLLRRASERENLEKDALEAKIRLLEAKIEEHETIKRVEIMYEQAMQAMKSYSNDSVDDEYED